MGQAALFDDLLPSPQALPEGLVYETGFLDAAEEAELIGLIARMPLKEAQYKSYTARRRVVSYGGRFDYDTNELLPAGALIEELHPLRARVARWAGVEPEALAHVLVAEYLPGTPLGWHRDVPDFEAIFGVSLGSSALLRLRPYPPLRPRREDIVKLPVAPRSIYAMRGTARWAWQHSVAPVDATRWSITFRTARR
ncbi:alpha-ketoglutarate-dependent dioxygenase AlkB [Pelomonas sp. Root1444]|uniref:alpha-ketoglutarate-dependent dioxygenase AlkB n=1 Tax=Pelomonas sp. Root1444 TaxID=1736464 RepID=UPI00070374AC|nr:alpha-ketoglutarate-dependent dioxygenase AlkB [Pelomonas sp. Root1444]KQY80162.1 2OG-Fe(II) oxygenase [Pelomonas sp. Root1444]